MNLCTCQLSDAGNWHLEEKWKSIVVVSLLEDP